MEYFHWNQYFVLGLVKIDRQHHHLVDVINQLGHCLTQIEGASFENVESIFQELSRYAQYHFTEEEALMAEVGIDPRHLEKHNKEHTHFMQEVIQRHKLIKPEDLNTAMSLLKFLNHWLAYHILGMDRSMATQIAAILKGQLPADAYLFEQENRQKSTAPLLAAVNGLFEQVSERNRDLVQLNQSLESKVFERTQALLAANERLEYVAMTDVLTGLPNRRYALKYLTEEWAESVKNNAPLTCMMIDADHFKQINDAYGHDAGDEVLRMLSRQLKNSVRTDDIVARLGGDEFLIVCARTPLEMAMKLAEKIRLKVNQLCVPAGAGLWHGSISVGVATTTHEMQSLEDLLKAADEGVYRAKRNGRNCVAHK